MPTTPVHSSQFIRLLDERLREVAENKYADLPKYRDMFYRMLPSDSAFEEFYEVGSLQDIPEFNGKVTYLGVAPGYHVQIEHKEFSAGTAIERKLIDDKKYNVMDDRAAGLMESADRTMDKYAVNIFNGAFSAAFDFMTTEEGLALCSNSHTTKAGTSTSSGFDNLATGALNKTNLAAARLQMRLFRNDISERINVGDDLALVVPDALADTAYEIVGTPNGLYTAELTKNMHYQRYEVIPCLRLDDDDTNNWFLVWKSQMKKDLVWSDRIKPEITTHIDKETFNVKTIVYFRFSYGRLGWRWILGSQVS